MHGGHEAWARCLRHPAQREPAQPRRQPRTRMHDVRPPVGEHVVADGSAGLEAQLADALRLGRAVLLGRRDGHGDDGLRDAAFGRQRYWGEPIPIYYQDGIPYPLPESELPLKLPEVDKLTNIVFMGQGGHSGAEIHKNRANANKVMGEFMDRIQKLMPLCLTSLSGGTKDNAIPRSCQATLVAMGIQLERINAVAEELQAEVREKYDEPDAVIQAFDVDALGGNGLSTQATAKVIGLLCAAPNGVQARSKDIEGLVQTSLNMGITKLGERFNVTFSVRSSVNSEKEDLLEKLKGLAEFFEGNYSQSGEYPAWEFRKDSVLRDTMVRIYREMFGKEPQVLAIHAGLECGLLGEKLPGLDCVSIGPQMHDIHTSREKLDIASTERTWNFLLEVLKNL